MSTILEIQTMWSLFIVLVVQMITVKFFEATNTISPHKAQVLVQLSVFQIISWILFTSTVLYLKSKTKLSWLSNELLKQKYFKLETCQWILHKSLLICH